MLRHFYRPEDPYRNPSENESLVVEAHVYGVADKYDVPELKESSRQNFRRILLDDYTETVEKELLPTVRIVFTTTGEDDRGLRSLVLTKALTEIRKLKQDPGFDTLLKEVPQFTAELFQMFLVNWDRGTETCYACHVGRARLTYKGFTCQKCGHDFKIGVKTGEREAKE